MSKLTLSSKEVERIADRYIQQVDKYSRMFAGLSTCLVHYCDGIMYIEISNSRTQVLSTYNTAVSYACNYRKFNPELRSAIGFVVIFFDRDNIPGFVINQSAGEDVIQGLMDQFNKPENPRVKKVYAGMFTEEMEKVKKDLVQDN